VSEFSLWIVKWKGDERKCLWLIRNSYTGVAEKEHVSIRFINGWSEAWTLYLPNTKQGVLGIFDRNIGDRRNYLMSLCPGWPGVRLSVLWNVHIGFGAYAAYWSMGTGLFLWKQSGRRVKLTARLHLVLRLVSAGVPFLPLMPFVACAPRVHLVCS
jgi:hypothetical protein